MRGKERPVEETQELTTDDVAAIPAEHLQNKTVALGDPDAHSHAWMTRGTDEGGSHQLVCACGETGVGFGEFPPETPAEGQ